MGCSKEELESHLAQTYNDSRRDEELQQPKGGLQRPTEPGIPFDLSDMKKKEVDDFIKKARSKSSPGNDGISYKMYKQCPKLRKQLLLLLRQMFRKKDAAERWYLAEGIYLPKEEVSKEIGQFRTISLLNVDGKIYFGILAARVMKFVQSNGYINETVQKAGVPGIPGCVEHAFTIWDAIQKSKEEKGDLSVVWLDLANAYGSVPHKLLKMAMEHFWIPEEIQKLMMKYYDNFMMRFTVGDFTTEWQRLEIGIAAGCTISVIWFVLVMEMVIRSTDTSGAEIQTPLKAFMDDITVLSISERATHRMLGRLDELIAWSRMKFKAKKSRSCTFRKGNQIEVRYTIAGEPIPTVREQPVKSLGRMYKENLSDRGQGVEIFNQATDSLKEIDHAKLPGKFKLWCLQFGLYPRLLWPLMIYEGAQLRVEMIKKNNAYVCTCKRDTISKNRREMMSCECSARDVKQNEEKWKQMFDKYKPGEAIVRFRGDMESKNTVMRDPVLFRINDARHPRLAEKYRVWPSYDFAVAVEDYSDGITHALRSKEYELRNELYHAILNALDMKHPKMLEFSRLEFKGMPVSKRVLRPLIDEGKVSWYDDPRLPTLEALKRRGISPEAIRKFTLSLSLTKADTLAPFDSLEAFNRKIVDGNSIRLFMVKDPRTLKISNLPNSTVELPNHPSNKMGTRKVMVGDSVFLSSEDVKDLKTGDQLRLIGLGNVKITSINSEITGEFTDDEHNVKFMKLQWVSEKNAHELKILIPQQLFVDDKFNEESLEEIQVYTEPHYLELKNDEEIQFVRFGYCRKDSSKQAIFTHK